ncbi:hypothetical protein NHQ30_009953 [Ciborinia camelliae]|nr:hypothetical protein NHQ30_009953 [Ciborinia camelliae]
MSANEITSIRSGIPPFLNCPFEIRLMIYRLLIPSIDPSADFNWTSAWDPNHPKSRSEEHKLYSPPILHTNQMVYREVLNELYCFLPYRTSISNYGIRFLGYTAREKPLSVEKKPWSPKPVRGKEVDGERYFEFQSECFRFVFGAERGIFGYDSRVHEPVG